MSNQEPLPFDASRIKLDEITIIQSRIDNPSSLVKLPPDNDLDIQFNITPSYSVQLKKLRIVFKCDLSAKAQNISGCFEAAFYFTMDKIEDLVQLVDNDTNLNIDNTLLATVLNISYSTARGIIYTRSLGTVLDKLILPVMSTNALLKPFEE